MQEDLGSDHARSRTASAKVPPGECREKVRAAGVERKTQEEDRGGPKQGDGLRRQVTEVKGRGHLGKYLPRPQHELMVLCTRVVAWRWREEASYRIHTRGGKDEACRWIEQEPQEKDLT